jgi:ATP-dependent protease Clp ATPase subunit
MLRCSFCNRTEKEVKKLLAGPKVYICDGCVKIATDVMEHGAAPPSVRSAKRSLIIRVFQRLFHGAGFRSALAQ